jgi:hypothetical protein
VIGSLLLLSTSAVDATTLPCAPCVGVLVDDPLSAVTALANEPQLQEQANLYIAWSVPVDGTADVSAVAAVRSAGATPWVRAVLVTPAPIADHLDRLEAELEALAELARSAGEGAFIQAVWQPENGGQPDAGDHVFLIKRAAVAVTGAMPAAAFVAGPLAADSAYLRALYDEEVAAYLDLVAIAPGADLETTIATLTELDPGKPIALDALAWPEQPLSAVALAAESTAAGVAVTFFAVATPDAAGLAPLKVLAGELSGELSYNQYAGPQGIESAWAFVDPDLGLRVVVEPPPDQLWVTLGFGDPQLRTPVRIDLATGEEIAVPHVSRTARGVSVTVDDPDPVVLLRLERTSVEEIDGFAERIDIAGERQMPVEEILRRLQAFEDDQVRRIDHYQATGALYLRVQTAETAVEASYSGDFFFQRGKGYDWVWQDFYVEGVKWRSKRLPELPLIQPEKAAALPVEIRLSKDYSYRLRGTATIEDRDCWVVDFRPVTVAPGRSLYQGTVWVDREIYARVRTRAIQVGLEGDVISNEETHYYRPVDRAGQESAWASESFILPLRIIGQQTLSIVGAEVPLERETRLTGLRINGEGFAQSLEQARASEMTMVRDTDDGLRYLRKDEDGQRVVETEQDTSRLFAVGGVFWDESVDFPLPLAGVDYLDLDFRDTGSQINLFFAGVYLNAIYSDPSLFDSRWNANATLSGFFIKRGDELYRDGNEVPEEEVESSFVAGEVSIGRPLGSFLTMDLSYRLDKDKYSRADNTAEEFVLPQSTMTHTFETKLTYNRSGYRLGLTGSASSRSDWQPWGLPGNTEYHPDQQDYSRWQVTLSKTWWFSKFRKLGVYLEHLDGSNLDRFSSYDFGIFGDSSVGGYQSGLVRAEEADGLHIEYGINAYDLFRFELEGDAVWASNQAIGLDRELLAGIGIGGTVTLPWQLLCNFEVGYALAGPAEGDVALRIAFLKLFPGK